MQIAYPDFGIKLVGKMTVLGPTRVLMMISKVVFRKLVISVHHWVLWWRWLDKCH